MRHAAGQGLQLDAEVVFEATLALALTRAEAIEPLVEVDVTFEGAEPIEVGAVLALPPRALEHLRRERAEPYLDGSPRVEACAVTNL